MCVFRSRFERLYFMVTQVGLLNILHNRPIVFIILWSLSNGVWVSNIKKLHTVSC